MFDNKKSFVQLRNNSVVSKRAKKYNSSKHVLKFLLCNSGFTLIELMITVAIIGILAAVAVPNFVAYRNRSRVAAATTTCESLRGSQAGYAADEANNLFPDTSNLSDWSDLRSIMSGQGVNLRADAEMHCISNIFTYETIDVDGDGTRDDYYFIFRVVGVPSTLTGSQIEIRPAGIMKQTF